MFEIKSTKYNQNISTPMLFGSGKNILSFGSMAASASSKTSSGGFAANYCTIGSAGFNLVS